MLEAQLLSKVIDENAFYEMQRYNVTAADFPTLGDVYEFVRDYVKESGTTPDYRTVVAKFEGFDYYPEVTDSYKYLCTRMKSTTAKRQSFELLQQQAPDRFKSMQGTEFVKWLRSETDRIARQADQATALGINYATNGAERSEWYDDASENRSFQFIPTPYRSLTKALGGGFELGDYELIMAFTNRGKSWLASDCGLASWRAGFGVLHYSPELSQRQQALRLDTLNGHFNNVDLRRGQLGNEAEYKTYLKQFAPDKQETPYIIKTMEDLPQGLTIDVIESDLQMHPNIKMVIIDGFNLMRHGKGGNSREGMTTTSRMLRQLFGRYGVAGIVVHQAPAAAERDKAKGEDGTRLVAPPKLTDYSETIAVIQDAATVLTFDQVDGIGKLSIEKAREPSVGTEIELSCNFNMGVIQEQDATSMF